MKAIPFNQLVQLLGYEHPSEVLIRGFAIDSRRIDKGDLFFALPGKKVDGHTFLSEVASKGAVAAVVSKEYKGEPFGLSLLLVDDVLLFLQHLAKAVLANRKNKVIGITGSLGKTTTKEFLLQLMQTTFKVSANPLSYNSQATLPLSILKAKGDEDFLILEMGMSEPGNIAQLISIAPPDIALITTIAPQHTCNFSDGLKGVCKEKASIFTHSRTQIGFLSKDIDHFEEVFSFGKCAKKTFSLQDPRADYYLELSSDGAIVYNQGESHAIKLSLPMKAHFQNFLAAACVATSLGVSWENIKKTAPLLLLPAMRYEKLEKQGITFINDAFNANPDSMKAALESLPKPLQGGRTIAVISEMDSLGMYSEAGHSLVAEVALQTVDYLLCVGSRCEIMRKIWKKDRKPFELHESKEDLSKRLKEIAQKGDVVLLKGARAYALETLLTQF